MMKRGSYEILEELKVIWGKWARNSLRVISENEVDTEVNIVSEPKRDNDCTESALTATINTSKLTAFTKKRKQRSEFMKNLLAAFPNPADMPENDDVVLQILRRKGMSPLK